MLPPFPVGRNAPVKGNHHEAIGCLIGGFCGIFTRPENVRLLLSLGVVFGLVFPIQLGKEDHKRRWIVWCLLGVSIPFWSVIEYRFTTERENAGYRLLVHAAWQMTGHS